MVEQERPAKGTGMDTASCDIQTVISEGLVARSGSGVERAVARVEMGVVGGRRVGRELELRMKPGVLCMKPGVLCVV